MQWKEVESSQIHSVGYDDATQTLGIRFKPNRKQKSEGVEFTEYHYANVTKGMYDGLVEAESVGRYFGSYIKPFPQDFPYTKVE